MNRPWPFVIEYVLYVASTSLAVIILVMSAAFVHMMLNPLIPNDPIYKIIGPAFQDIVIAFIGLVASVGGYIVGDKIGRAAEREKESASA